MSSEKKVPPFVIASDRMLVAVVLAKPKTKDELLACYGFGETKYEQIGKQILSIVNEHINF